MASCPAHDDHSPSLSVTENKDQSLLIHCFAGCNTVDEILPAVGLTASDLYPERVSHYTGPRRIQQPDYKRLFRMAQTEVLIVVLASGDLRRGKPLNAYDQARLNQAHQNLMKLGRMDV